ncbi:MAG: WG repeat-containing protein [Deltaproteobacteria bacterium]|nr:WG repeat-containing protein [Deltaproteobacteria bacterium]
MSRLIAVFISVLFLATTSWFGPISEVKAQVESGAPEADPAPIPFGSIEGPIAPTDTPSSEVKETGPLYPTEGPGGLYGYANQSGVMVINSVFTAANPFQRDGTAWVKYNGGFGTIDKEGRWVSEPNLKLGRVSEFYKNGLAEAESENGLVGFINALGQWVIEPTFKRTHGFADDNLAPVMGLDSKWGYIDNKGSYVIEPSYLKARHFAPNDLALVQVESGLYGYLDRNGHLAIAAKYKEARSFGATGLAAAKPAESELFGLIDQNGDMIVEPSYSQAAEPSTNELQGLADPQGLWGFVDSSGQWVIGPKYQRVGPFGPNGLARFRLEDGTMGLLNQRDQWVLEPMFLFVGAFTSQKKTTEYTQAHSREGLWGIINFSGEWVVPPDFLYCHYRLDGLIMVKEQDNQSFGYYNLEGEPRVPLGYDKTAERKTKTSPR